MAVRLSQVSLFVRDLDAVVAFYERGLGLTVRQRQAGQVVFDAGGCEITVQYAATPARSKTRLSFVADDVAATRLALAAAGGKVGKLYEAEGHPSWCEGKDPEGNGFLVMGCAKPPAADGTNDGKPGHR